MGLRSDAPPHKDPLLNKSIVFGRVPLLESVTRAERNPRAILARDPVLPKSLLSEESQWERPEKIFSSVRNDNVDVHVRTNTRSPGRIPAPKF